MGYACHEMLLRNKKDVHTQKNQKMQFNTAQVCWSSQYIMKRCLIKFNSQYGIEYLLIYVKEIILQPFSIINGHVGFHWMADPHSVGLVINLRVWSSTKISSDAENNCDDDNPPWSIMATILDSGFANIRWIIEKARELQKNIYFCLLTMPKPLTVWITINCGQFWKRWAYQTTWPAYWETYMQVRKQQLELDNNRLVPNRKRSTSRLYIVTLLIELLCRVHHEKHWAGRTTVWNQDCQEKYQYPQICRWHHLYGRK